MLRTMRDQARIRPADRGRERGNVVMSMALASFLDQGRARTLRAAVPGVHGFSGRAGLPPARGKERQTGAG
ncbi:hypothetical protein Shyhy02_22300 [Streptomyces hygroscopicus subsp. hygroscopicus]|nr:hypothetical protein Shyhy02_22300 [Streptomyces hygroscopicus subsp. hygroscopicus]